MSVLAIRMADLNELAEEPELQLRGSSIPVGAASCTLHVHLRPRGRRCWQGIPDLGRCPADGMRKYWSSTIIGRRFY